MGSTYERKNIAALACLVALWGGSDALAASQGGRRGGGAPSSGGSSEVEVEPISALAYPRGMQSFSELSPGVAVSRLEGWEISYGDASLFSVLVTDQAMGGDPSQPGDSRWMRVCDLSIDDGRNGFCTNSVVAPNARDYVWSLRLNIEAVDGVGPVLPALMIQHMGAEGYGDLFGLQFAPDGLYCVVRGLGGDRARRRLGNYSGSTAFGQWMEVILRTDFDAGEVTCRLNGEAPVRLPLHPRRGTDLREVRMAYQGAGTGNAATVLLDDVAIAFGASTCEESLLVDFDTEDDLATPLANGQDLSTPPEFGNLFAISSSGPNAGPAIFDSTPMGPNDPSQDRDLLVGLGNIVILQSDRVATQTVPGFFDRPNDDEDGGSVFFSFTRPLEVMGLDLVDIDQGIEQQVVVVLTDMGGLNRVYTVPAGFTEDLLINGGPGVRTLSTTTLLPQAGFTSSATAVQDNGFESDAVVFLAVQFGSSGALDNLELRLPCARLDFETEDDGLTTLANGQDISTPPEFGLSVSLTSSGPNAGAAIFDSDPGGPNDPSQDRDLLVGLGNLLILQNNNAAQSLVQTVPGIFDLPNDDSDGGTILFSFAAPSEPRLIDLVDIDPGLPNSSLVVLTDENNRTRTYFVPAGWTEDVLDHGGAGFRSLDLRALLPQPGFSAPATASEDAGYDPRRVVRLLVNLGSSGGIDNLCFCP